MAEEFSSIKVHIEVDTNKQTYELKGERDNLGAAEDRIADFFEAIRERLS